MVVVFVAEVLQWVCVDGCKCGLCTLLVSLDSCGIEESADDWQLMWRFLANWWLIDRLFVRELFDADDDDDDDEDDDDDDEEGNKTLDDSCSCEELGERL